MATWVALLALLMLAVCLPSGRCAPVTLFASNFHEAVRGKNVLVTFYSPGCIICRNMMDQFVEASDIVEAKGLNVTFVLVDLLYPENEPFVDAFDISKFPHILAMRKNRVVIAHYTGPRSTQDFVELAEKLPRATKKSPLFKPFVNPPPHSAWNYFVYRLYVLYYLLYTDYFYLKAFKKNVMVFFFLLGMLCAFVLRKTMIYFRRRRAAHAKQD
eukprot:m.191586 g.191586  ORF g.191586 m.191586 type:complete len:214 (+) comp21723_c1_seq11:662-1303(+)